MKTKTTQREVKATHEYTIAANNGKLQKLLTYCEPYAYVENKEGHAADIYSFGSIAIITGRAPFGGYKASDELCKKYEFIARQTLQSLRQDGANYGESKDVLNMLIQHFIEEVTK